MKTSKINRKKKTYLNKAYVWKAGKTHLLNSTTFWIKSCFLQTSLTEKGSNPERIMLQKMKPQAINQGQQPRYLKRKTDDLATQTDYCKKTQNLGKRQSKSQRNNSHPKSNLPPFWIFHQTHTILETKQILSEWLAQTILSRKNLEQLLVEKTQKVAWTKFDPQNLKTQVFKTRIWFWQTHKIVKPAANFHKTK